MIKKILPIILFIFSFSLIILIFSYNISFDNQEITKEPVRETSMVLSEEDKLEREIFYLEKEIEGKEEKIEELKSRNDLKDLLIGISGFILNILSILNILKVFKRKKD